jgi:GMP synthase-like glutamine amidotransferase
MKLGILDAVPAEYLAIDDNISDGQKFIDFLNAVGLQAELVVYNVGEDEFPASLDECDAYLITGSPVSVYDDYPWIQRLMDFVRQGHQNQKRMVGICFGHQLIAEALGGKVLEAPASWHLGLLEFEVMNPPAWMMDEAESCKIYHINKDQVVRLPEHAVKLGGSGACPNSMYIVDDHIFCIQGHPEQPLRAMNNFIVALGDEVPAQIVASARRSFDEGEPDSLRVGLWIRRFLENG